MKYSPGRNNPLEHVIIHTIDSEGKHKIRSLDASSVVIDERPEYVDWTYGESTMLSTRTIAITGNERSDQVVAPTLSEGIASLAQLLTERSQKAEAKVKDLQGQLKYAQKEAKEKEAKQKEAKRAYLRGLIDDYLSAHPEDAASELYEFDPKDAWEGLV